MKIETHKSMDIRSHTEIELIVRRFVVDTFMAASGLDSFKDTDSFMDNGIIDSTGILELIGFIEDSFDIKVEDEEIIPDNLDSLRSVTRYVQRKLRHAGQ